MRLLLFTIVSFCGVNACAAEPVVVSAAGSNVGVAPGSLASVFADNISTMTVAATSLPWPTSLGDVAVVYVVDSNSAMRMASIFYVSSSQMNIWIPPQTAPGPANVEFPVTGLPPGVGSAALRLVPVTIQKVAPGIFSANGSGSGVAAASAVRVSLGTGLQTPVPVFQCDAAATCTATPIDTGLDQPVYLSLYGTGIRGETNLANIVVTIGNTNIQPLYAGPQPQIPGLDQVNVGLPLSLRGSGLVSVTVTVDGVASNAVQIDIQ